MCFGNASLSSKNTCKDITSVLFTVKCLIGEAGEVLKVHV